MNTEGGLILLFGGLIVIPGVFVLVYLINRLAGRKIIPPWLLIVLLILLPIAALIIYFQQQFRIANYKSREELSALNSTLQENIVGIGVVQLFRREQFNANLFNNVNPIGFSGVQSSPFFGQPTAALPGRRMETGLRFSF